MGRRQTHRTTSHHRDFKGQLWLLAARVDVDRTLGFGPVILGEEALQSADGNWFVNLSAAAGRLARVSADATANRGQGIWVSRKPIGLFETPFPNEFYIPASMGVRGTSHHAREVRVEPVAVDPLIF